jgi:hypothetical protein
MFRDRADGAYQLANLARHRQFHDLLVLTIPRGGVVTGAVLARELGAELDVVLSRKLRAPKQKEAAIGAVGENGSICLIWADLGTFGHALRDLESRRGLSSADLPSARHVASLLSWPGLAYFGSVWRSLAFPCPEISGFVRFRHTIASREISPSTRHTPPATISSAGRIRPHLAGLQETAIHIFF